MLSDEEKIKIKNSFELIGFTPNLFDFECVYIEFVLEKKDWNKTQTALTLNVSLRTFRDWCIRKRPIDIPEYKTWKRTTIKG